MQTETAPHTPGPWESHIAFDGSYPITRTDGFRLAETYPGDDPESRANARLIAASPALLEALQAAAETLDTALDPSNLDEEMVKSALAQARAAIQQATNGS